MRIIRDHRDMRSAEHGAHCAIGMFDGVHLGHQAVINHAFSRAKNDQRPCGVVAFEPHPRDYFTKKRGNDEPLLRLTSLRLKSQIFASLGISFLALLRFNAQLADMTPHAFVHNILVQGLHLHHVTAGHDFRFGRARAGDAETLKSLAASEGLQVSIVPPVKDGKNLISSTAIRHALANADMTKAAQMLGRWWAINGRVSAGEKRGRLLGFPTANLRLNMSAFPALGVYAAIVFIPHLNKPHNAVVNIGRRPSFGGGAPLLEAHLLNYQGDLYGERLTVFPLAFLRAEKKFQNPQELAEQIARDKNHAERFLASSAPNAFTFAPIPS